MNVRIKPNNELLKPPTPEQWKWLWKKCNRKNLVVRGSSFSTDGKNYLYFNSLEIYLSNSQNRETFKKEVMPASIILMGGKTLDLVLPVLDRIQLEVLEKKEEPMAKNQGSVEGKQPRKKKKSGLPKKHGRGRNFNGGRKG